MPFILFALIQTGVCKLQLMFIVFYFYLYNKKKKQILVLILKILYWLDSTRQSTFLFL